MEKRAPALNVKQRRRLLDLLAENLPLARNEFTSSLHGCNKQRKCWEEIARKLNAMKGSSKPPEKWRKTWEDLRSRVRSKKSFIDACKANGVTTTRLMNEFDHRVIQLTTPATAANSVENSAAESTTMAPIYSDSSDTIKDEIIIDDSVDLAPSSRAPSPHPDMSYPNDTQPMDYGDMSTTASPRRMKPDMDEEFLIVQREKLELLRRLVQLKEEKRLREAEKHEVWMRLHATDPSCDPL